MKDTGKISDKGKNIATSENKAKDFIRVQAQERLKLDPQRDIQKGWMSRGETGKQQENDAEKTVRGGSTHGSSTSKPSRGTRGHGTDNIEAVTGERFKYKLGQSLTGIYSGGTTSGPAERIGTRGHGADNIEAVTGERFKYKLGQQDGGVYDKSNN